MGTWKTVLSIVSFVPLSLYLSPVFACDAPVELFCVDFYSGIHLEGKPLLTMKAPSVKYKGRNLRSRRKIPNHNFSARWRGRFQFSEGEYEFRVNMGEGIRLMIDGQLIINYWNASPEEPIEKRR